jgi:hypothetical protein
MMLRKLRRRLSYANVMSTLAVFLALAGGGTAVALSGSNTVFSDDIANDNFTSQTEGQGGLVASDLRAGSVGSSEVADGSLRAQDYGIGSVSGARIQDNNVTGLDIAEGAVFGGDIANNSLTGDDINEASLSLAAESWHEVGSPGEPAFNNPGGDLCDWKNFDTSHNSAAFLRDRFGFVHLKGLVDAENRGDCNLVDKVDTWIFRLPAGYRPARREVHVTLTNGALGRISIDGPALTPGLGAGAVSIDPPTTFANAEQWISLDGISFRCAPSGSNGCP